MLFVGRIVHQIIHAVSSGQRPDMTKLPRDLPSSITEIMQQCWAQLPKMRPQFAGWSFIFTFTLNGKSEAPLKYILQMKKSKIATSLLLIP